MQNQIRLNEEQQTIKWFLLLFYIILFSYDIFYHFFIKAEPGLPTVGLSYWFHIILVALLPIAYYLIKNNKPEKIKYIYFLTFSFLTIINDIMIYWGSTFSYSSGNIVELMIVLFSPIFVNKRYFVLVSLGTILRLGIVGVIIQDLAVFQPILIVTVLAFIAFILLNRFFSYITAVKNSYDKQLEGIVKGIISTLELKDPYTKGHSERVADYAITLAKETGKFKEDELNSFYNVCLLHDIGKIHIPDSILMKPGRLTNEEFEIIKTHPAVGAEAVKHVEGVAQHLEVIRSHHERWDGKGYPEQLKGEEVPLLARITAVADAFDAMTSSRSYRSALPITEAYNRIIEGSGTQFDPQLIELFKKVYPSWCVYHKKVSERENNN
ncbi:HD-GYP domain-containing protein [Alkalihalobacterium elongatum]|uniref:HD-GYP domain-containing protein n=1 Tax=Alkalihalobacterium elongatum TaxID=2675466 RepID=UPI001C1FBFA7|nr:HD-GYP domain-containing protein [Alkalihalobacterium elongatum]